MGSLRREESLPLATNLLPDGLGQEEGRDLNVWQEKKKKIVIGEKFVRNWGGDADSKALKGAGRKRLKKERRTLSSGERRGGQKESRE